MQSISAATVKALPVDELALQILADLKATKEWHEGNYLIKAQQDPRFVRDDAVHRALAEALGWLRSRGLIARTPGQTDAAIFVTRAGEAALRSGLRQVQAEERLQTGMHPLIEARARRQFLLGEYEQAVFVAMKAVEVRVRALGKFPNDLIGVDLMNQAFGASGALTDPNSVKGEREGTRSLFAGSYAVLRNPAGHREIDYEEVEEAAEAVLVASLLMRMLDRIEDRLGS